ncbi:ABC transporter permease [Niveispirillum sp. KHB5.9]|uniref:ABC transporter permease n=1 Tax=Niveispirillum sp. KHB5.9 TaxID=3400269 RepID=UPI003A884AD0
MRGLLQTLLANRKAAIGAAIVAIFILIALAAPLVAPFDINQRVAKPHEAPSVEHVMGATRMGRDVLSQTIHGTQTSLMVGFAAGLLVTVIGTAVGVTAGYFGGKVDEVLNLFTNISLVIPNLPLMLVLAAFIGQTGPFVIALIIGLTSWGWGARVTRAQTLSLRQRDYILAAEMLGEPAWRVIGFELLPNLISIIGFNFIGSILYSVITEATMEFLGLGDPMVVSWGTMLYHAQSTSALQVGAWWEMAAPCLALVIFGSGLSLVNFAVDEIANPRLRTLRVPARVLAGLTRTTTSQGGRA